jgi:hypothetical protein
MSLAERVVARKKHATLVSRVATRFKEAGDWDGKFIGKDARLTWSRAQFVLEELPQKGKKKLRRAEIQNPSWNHGPHWYIPDNILMLAKLSPSDDYQKIKAKIEDAYKEARQNIMTSTSPHDAWEKEYLEKNDWVDKIKWYENQVFYLNVVPEGTEPLSIEGKDFTVKTTWTEFSSYSPGSDFQQSDPHYTKYVSKSPTAARRFYVMMKEDPNALKSVSWTGFGDWLNKNKIPYDTRFSQWT